jgi:hypothetical protein
MKAHVWQYLLQTIPIVHPPLLPIRKLVAQFKDRQHLRSKQPYEIGKLIWSQLRHPHPSMPTSAQFAADGEQKIGFRRSFVRIAVVRKILQRTLMKNRRIYGESHRLVGVLWTKKPTSNRFIPFPISLVLFAPNQPEQFFRGRDHRSARIRIFSVSVHKMLCMRRASWRKGGWR